MNPSNHQYSPMGFTKRSAIALAVLAFGIFGTGVLVSSAVAKDKVAVQQLPTIQGVVVSLEGDVLTVDIKKVQKRLTLAADVTITLTPDRKNEGPHAGQRADIVSGIGVALTLGAAADTVREIQVMGRTAHGKITAVSDASMTIASKTKDGPTEETFTLTPATVIVLSYGKEKGSVQTGTAADLKVNMLVTVKLSAVDKTTAREVAVQPVTSKPKAFQPVPSKPKVQK